MTDNALRLLLIEDNADDRWLIEHSLQEVAGQHPFELEGVGQLSAGLERLQRGGIDAVLLDLTLPDSGGLDTFLRLRTQAPNVPVVILTGLDDEKLNLIAVREGAEDYFIKGQVSGQQLAQTLSRAILRHNLRQDAHSLPHVDDLTGLCNRRGFFTLAEQHWKLVRRMNRAFMLLFADIDGLKKINDAFGHPAGDAALRHTADVLRRTFRDSDILARLGWDEFTVLITEMPPDHGEGLKQRLHLNLKSCCHSEKTPYELALSVGLASFDPLEPITLEELISQAYKAMLEDKLNRRL